MVIENRKRIGIIFNFNGSWIGGVYYIQNIIKALNYLEDSQKPEILIFHTKELSSYAEEIKYPYIKTISWDYISVFKGFFLSFIYNENLFIKEIIDNYYLDGIYPLYDQPTSVSKEKTIIATWFPDLQHKIYPKNFHKLNLILREIRLKFMLKNTDVLVVSSNDVANHFYKFYRIKESLKIHVLPFVSIVDDIILDNSKDFISKYNLPNEYFMVSNHFYEHKNHMVILKAIVILRKMNLNVHFVFTGKMEDYRNPLYIDSLRDEIKRNGLERNISLLGIIPRQDQLCLLKNSKAVIQPSLFEGWSTVIEDAKSLQLPVIASNIDVHKEQLRDSGIFFNPKDEFELAKIIQLFSVNMSQQNYEDYHIRVRKFASSFISIFD